MLLLLPAAGASFPADNDHHHTIAQYSHHLTSAACVPQHHPTGEPLPAHGHRHESDIVSNLSPRSRLTDAIALAVACGSAAESAVPTSVTVPVVPPDVDFHPLGVLRA